MIIWTPVDARAVSLLPLLLAAACARGEAPSIPAPTEHRLDAGAEARNASGRKEWMEAMHRAAPGVDWREIERQNGLAAMARRQALLQGRAAASSAGRWKELGSRNLAGRMHAAALSAGGTVLYAGSALGSVWAAAPDGTGWTPLGDNLYGGAYEIGVVPAGTGQPDVLIRLAGKLVHRTVDWGATWTVPLGLNSLVDTMRILVLKDAVHTVLIVGRGPTSTGTQWNLYRSTDGGGSFSRVREMGQFRADIWTPRDALGPVYLVQGDRIWESTDGGASFTAIGNPAGLSATAAILAGSESPNLRFNVAFLSGGVWKLWRSADAGVTWSYLRDLVDFWESLAASSRDGSLLSYAGVEMWISRDGGATFNKKNDWWAYYGDPANMLHADVPGLHVAAGAALPGGESWFISTDGGLYRSDDQLLTVHNLSLSGLGVSQYYSTLTSRRRPDLVAAGSQDQGYQRADVGKPPPGGGPWADFVQLISGDYGHLTSSDGSHDYVYCVYPGFVLIQQGEESPRLSTANFPTGSEQLWMPPVVADPAERTAFFFCGRYLYRYIRDPYGRWISSPYSSQDFSPGVLSALAFSPLDFSRAWAATTAGRLYWSTDRGVTWTRALDSGPGSHYFYGTALLPSASDVQTVYVGGSGYSTAPVKVSRDGGVTWQPLRDGLPNTLVYGLCESPDASGALFAGSETGAWRYDPATNLWEDVLGTSAPITLYWCVETIPERNVVRFGTYGRGIWDLIQDTPGFFPYGELRGGANVLALEADGPPLVGQTVRITISGGRPTAAGELVVGERRADEPWRGGTRLLDPAGALRFSFTTDAGGRAAVDLAVPNDPALAGKERFLQAAVRDPAQPGGVALSHGLRGVVGL